MNRFRKRAFPALQRGSRWGRSVLRLAQANRGSLALLVLAVAVTVSVWKLISSLDWPSPAFWEWLQTGPDGMESGSTTIRNLGLVIGGAVALLLAIWRSWVAQRQADTAQQDLLNDRYQKGAEMLGSDVLSVRLGGIYNLEQLAAEYPEQYHLQVMKLFCTFVRIPTIYESVESRQLQVAPNAGGEGASQYMPPPTREDVQAIMTAIGARREAGIALEKKQNTTLDLHGADLSYVHLSGANLAGVNLSQANLSHVKFFEHYQPDIDLSEPIPSGPDQPKVRPILAGETIKPDLSGMEDRRANLSGAILNGADLSCAWILGTDLSGALLIDAKLSKADIIYADLRKAVLIGANLSKADFFVSDLSGAQLGGANLKGAQLISTKLYGTDFFGACLKDTNLSSALLSKNDGEFRAIGLTQKQLDQVRLDSSSQPSLAGIVCLGTDKPLVWPKKSSVNGK